MSPFLPRPVRLTYVGPFRNGVEGEERILVEAGANGFVMSRAAFALVSILGECTEPSEASRALGQRLGHAVSETELLEAVRRLPVALFEEGHGLVDEKIFLVRWQLLSSERVQWLARRLQHAFEPRAAVCLLVISLALAAIYLRLPWDMSPAGEAGARGSALLVLILILSAFVHELGHAAACQKFGVPPGHVGFGIYWGIPVFYADVTKAWRLAPPQRAIVDLGGVYFQAVFVLLAGAFMLCLHPGGPEVQLLLLYSAGVMLHNLNPLFKMDGYWLLSDMFKIPNLHRRVMDYVFGGRSIRRAEISGRFDYILSGYAGMVGVYAIYLAFGIPRWMERHFIPSWNAATQAGMKAVADSDVLSWGEIGGAIVHALILIAPVSLPMIAVPWGVSRVVVAIKRRWSSES